MQKEIIFSRFEEIKNRLRYAPSSPYKINEIKKEMLKFYADNSEKLEALTEKQFNAHCFVGELVRRCEAAEKQSLKPQLIKVLIGLERHQYAPELNSLLFASGQEIRTPGATDTKEALKQIINKSSVTTLKAIILTNN